MGAAVPCDARRFQTLGWTNEKYDPTIKAVAKIIAVAIACGFLIVAIGINFFLNPAE